MESSCSCYIGDYLPIECHTHETPKARKNYHCDECGGEIKKGEQYHIHKGMCDGSWFRLKNCNACESIRHDYGCGSIGELNEAVRECLGIGINEDPANVDYVPDPQPRTHKDGVLMGSTPNRRG